MADTVYKFRARVGDAVRSRPGSIRMSPPDTISRWRPPATMMRLSARPAMGRTTHPRLTMKRKRRYGRRRFKRNYIGRALQPYSVARWLNTAMYQALNPGAGTMTCVHLVLNGANDPMGDASATQQPLGFDQYEALYNKYCVVAWQIYFEVVTVDNATPIMIGFTPCTTLTTQSSYQHYKEMPATVQRVVTPDQDKVTFGTRGGVRRWLSPRGGKLLSNPDLSAETNAFPTRVLYGHLYAQAMDGVSDPGIVQIAIKMRQLIVFFDPKIPTRSVQ